MSREFIKRILLLCFVLSLFSTDAIAHQETNSRKIHIGVLAKRGSARCLDKWAPTAKYLTEKIPAYSFEIVPLGYDEVFPHVKSGEIDFILANSSFYVELEMLLGVQRIVTLNNLRFGKAYTIYGGVIFCKKDRDDLKTIRDLKGKRFISLDEKAFASWLTVWREIKEAGIDPYRDFDKLEFRGPMDEVVYAVRNGVADVGSVRTDLLEQMAQEGKIRLEEFHIINEHKTQNKEIRFLHSTRVYPEWPLAKVKHTANNLAKKVAVALISMPSDSEAAIAARCAGWTIPLNYQPVHDCLKELRIGPYKKYGEITIVAFLHQYGFWLAGIMGIFFLIFLLYMYRVNVKLNLSLVKLEKEIAERKQAELEKRKLEVQLRQTQKMEAIGTLAGGIAHDFNNILGALIGYADLAKDDIPEGTVAYQNQKEVLIAANRAKELVKQILTFGRKDEAKLIPVQINTIAREALKLLRSSLPTTIEINQDINCNSSIMADETHIHQVLLNLGTNAAHAMEDKGGVLEVNLTDVNIDSDIMTRDGLLKQGSYVKLSLKDTGCGMSKDVQERMFEPFYTTKEVGKGTGMGLTVVHGIVENHNGLMTVDSKPEEGTTFEIFFPYVEDIEIIETEDSEVINGQREQILVVDDEQLLIDMTIQMLTRIGYEVVGKTNSIEALEAFRENPNKFDLVITDQTMPNMIGTDLAKELLSIRPDIPIVLFTGFSEGVDVESVKAIGIREFVMKPVNCKEMSQIIRGILDKKGVAVECPCFMYQLL